MKTMTKRYTVWGATIGLSAVLLSGAFANTTLFNNDNLVDDADLLIVLFNFGAGC